MSEKIWPPPGFPIVEGIYALTSEWSINLPERFARRIEDGSLVLWRPGLTIWLVAWGNDRRESQAERLAWIKESASEERFAESHEVTDRVTRYSYRLRDQNPDGAVESLHAYILSDDGHLQMAIYFDDPSEEDLTRRLASSVVEHRAG